MSEIKRVALNTLEPQKVNDKVIKKLCKTVRISVILPESNEDNSPEYNYKDQLAAVVKKKVKQNKEPNGLENGLDPFGENDDDVRRIALEMEAKYGSGVTKKKTKGKKDDYADIGMGYDESDSFIDNTDGYDEIIPQHVTTLHGGFYVNSGALVFKTDDEASSDASSSASSSSDTSSSSDSEGEEKEKTKTRKRILDTSADSDSDTANPAEKEKKPKVQSETPTSMQQAIKKKLFSTTKIQVKKRRPIDPLKKTVKDLLREKREDLNMTIPDELKTVEDNIEKESSKENKKPMSITSVTDAIESVLKQVVEEEEEDYDKNQNKSPVDVSQSAVLSQNKIDSSHSQAKEKDKQNLTRLEKEEIVKLPENLPTDIEAIVSKLKEAALNYKGEGKKAFFTKDVNALLLSLEKKSKSISKSSRVKVYEHLSQYVNCTKDTLTRRARILDLEDNERRLRGLEVKLKDAIGAIMPALLENFQMESQKVLEKKFSKESVNNEELKALKMPRRKFPWNEETKKLLKDVLSVKKRCLFLEGKQKDSLLEEQVVDYLRTKIVPLWPEGWMYLNTLKKILNRMQDNSKPTSTNSIPSTVSVKPPKHSNLSITPVTNGKINTDKPEITNSITVTKVVNPNDVNVGDSVKNNTKPIIEKSSEIKQDISIVNEIDDKSLPNSHNDIEIYKDYSNTTTKSHEAVEPASDLSIHGKKNDVFKPYIEDTPQIKKPYPDVGKSQQTYQKSSSKQNEMFKPYADDISIDKNIPVKAAKYDENYLSVFNQYPVKEKSVGHEKEKIDSHSYPEKEKQSAPINLEKDKYSSHTYSSRDDHSLRTYSQKDKINAHSYIEKDKHSSHTYPDKDKHSSHTYPDKDKHSSHTYPDKDKHSSHSYSDKDKHTSHVYPEKDKHSSHSYSDKDKHSSHTYSEKDKHSAHSYVDKHSAVTYSEKDKSSSHIYPDKDKHSGIMYSDKDKTSSHIYPDKDKHSSLLYTDKEKHNSLIYSDNNKHGFHSYSEKDKHSYSNKDKHGSHVYSDKDKSSVNAYSEKDKANLHTYSNKDKSSSHTYADKDKQSSHAYSSKDKSSSHTYTDKDKPSSHGYSNKDKSSSHTYSDKEKHAYSSKEKSSSHTYSDKDKQSSHSYSNKDKSSSHTYSNKDKPSSHLYSDKDKQSSLAYSDKDKQTSHTYSDKDKHSSHTYSDKDKYNSLLYTEKDKHSFHTYSEKYMDKNKPLSLQVDKKIDEKQLHLPDRSPQLDNIPTNLANPLEKPTDLSKFQMFKPYSDTPKSHCEEPAMYKPKDINKIPKPIDYKSKEEKHLRPMDVLMSISQDSSNFSTKSYTAPSDYHTSRYDVSSKHLTANTHSFQGGNMNNDLTPSMEDSGVIVKNVQQKAEKLTREDKKDHHNPVIPKTAHCQGVKRKLLETYSRNVTEMATPNYFPVAPNKHSEYTNPTPTKHADYATSTPLVTAKSDGDGQKDIQMVMENLKALQKLSCSPVKNDNSSSSPVSVIAYNKNFTTSKTTTSAHGLSSLSRNDMNSRNDFTGGFQDEFQKQFINSLQQMTANANSSKSSYNNGS